MSMILSTGTPIACSTSWMADSAPAPRSWRLRPTATPASCAPAAVDHGNHLAHGRARRDDIVDDQHPTLQRGAHQQPTLPVALGFLAVVSERHVYAVVVGQGDRGGRGQGNALVGRAEQDIKLQPGIHNSAGVATTECRQGPAAGKTRLH